jgi:hypothetical protein
MSNTYYVFDPDNIYTSRKGFIRYKDARKYLKRLKSEGKPKQVILTLREYNKLLFKSSGVV